MGIQLLKLFPCYKSLHQRQHKCKQIILMKVLLMLIGELSKMLSINFEQHLLCKLINQGMIHLRRLLMGLQESNEPFQEYHWCQSLNIYNYNYWQECIANQFLNYIILVIQMSKAKGKDKKNQNNNADHEVLEQQKREILQQSFTIKRLQDRLSRMTEENHQISTTKDKFQQEYEERIDKQRIIIESHQNNIRQNRGKIYDLQVSKMTLQNRIKDLQRELRDQQAMKNKQFDQYRRVTQNEMGRLQVMLKEYNIYMGQRQEVKNQNTNLNRKIEAEKEERTKQVADKERQKVQAIDMLRDEMLTKIKDMRSNLLSLKKEQLDTTTRLAVLQNHQLTSELQFQSKQSQKLVFQNEQLIKKVSNLQKDLDIHRQIEEELAKRSHYSRGIIKKLTNKISQLQQNLKQANQRSQLHNVQPVKSNNNEINKEQVIRTLDKSLQNTQKKFLKLQSQAQLTKNQLTLLRSKIEQYEKRSNGLLDILLKAYGEFEQGNLLANSGGYQIDLNSLRKKDVQEWSKEQLKLVLNAIIQQVATLVNKKSLNLPIAFRPQEISVLDSDQTINNVRLPKISEHSTSKLELSMKLKELPVSIGSKLVGSQIRDWGRTVHSSSHVNLARKYKVYDK